MTTETRDYLAHRDEIGQTRYRLDAVHSAEADDDTYPWYVTIGEYASLEEVNAAVAANVPTYKVFTVGTGYWDVNYYTKGDTEIVDAYWVDQDRDLYGEWDNEEKAVIWE